MTELNIDDSQRRVKNDLMHALTDLYTISQNEAWYVLVMKGYDVGIKRLRMPEKGPYRPY